MRILFLLAALLAAMPAWAQHTPGMRMGKSAEPHLTQSAPPAAQLQGKVVTPRTSYVGKRVEYDLYVDERLVNFTGRTRRAIGINGQIPAPTLTFNEGDTAVIRVHNQMHMETSIHWHGLLLPNEQDGVPYLNTAPVEPGGTHTFTFPLIQSGTYWYHSHTMLQEQDGVYGSIVIHPKRIPYEMREYVLVLSDWTDHKSKEVLRYLKRTGEWFAVQKGATQSYGEALAAGYFKDKLKQEWGRMPAMDLTDIYYNKFLTNGQEKGYFKDAKPGEVVRLRVINGSASSYFYLQYAGGPMQVIAADGINVEPFPVNKLEIATAETYDLLVTVPAVGAAEFRATANDITGYTSTFIGQGEPMKAPDLPRINYFQMMREMNSMEGMSGMDMGGAGMTKEQGSGEMKGMDMAGHQGPKPASPAAGSPMPGMDMQHGAAPAATAPSPQSRPENAQEKAGKSMGSMQDMGGMAGMDMGGMAGMSGMGGSAGDFNYNMLRALNPTTLDSTKQWREINLTLTGNMLRYVWSFDNKTLSQADKIPIRKGENVRMTFTNTTMMRHPLHLHGHFFRLVNAQGAYSPMKHTFDIQSMGKVTIEFDANEEQDWFFHCHILYHMMAGMARIVSYEGTPQNEYARTDYKELKKEDNQPYLWADLMAHSQGAFLESTLSNNRNALEFEGRVNYQGNFETETHLLRYLDNRQFLAAFVGFDYRNNRTLLAEGERNTKNNRRVFDVGLYYLLPLLVRSELRLDSNGKVRLQLERTDLPLSNNFFADLLVNTDREYNVAFRYMVSKYVSLSTNYDSDYKWGAGLTLHY
ncbi:multicopper oxidase domain-containing protein [Microvirga sp. STR05]|uniref:Multicopper oxidase domain-containing protein n=1 Tax=Hymenobacter duratus TaxID=2771356 RepID=A0ABR8JP51_9BACT|nr:multicopper oxidase domain-containing protein [Hymenobacter duratus]MBD2717220.1 multicopper oxidase domain-containing protein [Hymenobacter duratus]MBR7952139.1 multicopper oxidase domain-containing protein [Microvirga sp. STR05]